MLPYSEGIVLRTPRGTPDGQEPRSWLARSALLAIKAPPGSMCKFLDAWKIGRMAALSGMTAEPRNGGACTHLQVARANANVGRRIQSPGELALHS